MTQRGFTLIELVVVVAIVGVLASAAMPLARWSVKRNREILLQQNLRILRNAIDRYHDAAQNGLIEVPEGTSGYPPTLEALVEGVPLLGQMPPTMPAVSDEYGASGAGLGGGIGSQLQSGQPASFGAGVQPASAGGTAGGQRTSLFGSSVAAGGTRFSTAGPQASGGQASGGAMATTSAGRRPGSLMADLRATRSGASSGASVASGLRPGAAGIGDPRQPGEASNEPLIGPDGKPVKVMFLRRIPADPITGKTEWGVRCYGEPPTDRLWCGRDVFDVYSKAFSNAIDGTKYRDW